LRVIRLCESLPAKISVAAEEADESEGWLQALLDAHLGPASELRTLIEEAQSLVKIFTASGKTAKSNLAAGGRRRNPQSTINN
jgi:hypothetical protein